MGKGGKLRPGVRDARGSSKVEGVRREEGDDLEDARGCGEVRKGEESKRTEFKGRGGGAQVPQPQAGRRSAMLARVFALHLT